VKKGDDQGKTGPVYIFETARLTATRLAKGDLPDLVTLHLDPEVSRFLGGVRTAAATARYLETNLGHWADHGVGLWTLRTEDGAFAGRAGLRYVDVEGVPELEIAYAFVKSLWGQGFATEIAMALAELWNTKRTDPSLVGIVMKGNVASEGVLLKAGLAYERDALFHGEICGVFRSCR
jgi:RimJ/RimL family protein N-acetyltransferase